MARRTYQQRCALAQALDVVGERWTLLLVRELLSGPKRYGELLEGLAGIGTNLLAARLKELEAAEVVERGDGRYSLTARGRELEDAVVALARFGAPLLADADPHGLWRADWNVVALKYAFRPERAKTLRGVLELRIDDSVVQARLREGAIETAGGSPWKMTAALRADGETFLGLASGSLALGEAERDGRVEIEGDRRFLRSSLRAFGAPR